MGKGIHYYGPRRYTGHETSAGGHPWMRDEEFQRLWEESLTRSLLHVIDSRESLQGAEPGLAFW